MNRLGQTFLTCAVGLTGGLIGSMLMSSPTATPSGTSADGSSAELVAGSDFGATLSVIQADLDMLTQEVALQRNSMNSLDTRLAGALSSQSEMSAAGGTGALALSGIDPGETPSGKGFDAAVNAAIEKREGDEAATRDADREVRRDERLDREMERWITELGLSADQASEMRTILNNTSKARTDFFAEMRASGNMDRSTMREAFAEMGEAQNEQLGDVLDATQMENYFESSANSGFGGSGGLADKSGS